MIDRLNEIKEELAALAYGREKSGSSIFAAIDYLDDAIAYETEALGTEADKIEGAIIDAAEFRK